MSAALPRAGAPLLSPLRLVPCPCPEVAGGLVVLAAHPDDETIGAAALLAAAPDAVVVHLTDGAPRDRRFWSRDAAAATTPAAYAALRRAELDRALAVLGRSAAETLSLGAPDQEAVIHLGPLALALAALLRARRPRAVVTHPYEGGHPDHDATAFAARAAVALLRREGGPVPHLVEMTSYHAGPEGLVTGRFLPAPGTPEAVRPLGPPLRALKERMLAAFSSQREVLEPFGAVEERFRSAPAADFAAPPHEGPLWYERLGFPVAGRAWRMLARQAAERLDLPLAL